MFTGLALELDTACAQINCSRVVDVETGSPATLYCNLNCRPISKKFPEWYYYYYYHDLNVIVPDLVHNGHSLNPSWSSRGISVHYNHPVAQSVLTIEKVTTNVTGIYECSTHADDNDGCRMRFCLSSGEDLTLHYILWSQIEIQRVILFFLSSYSLLRHLNSENGHSVCNAINLR